MAISRGRVALDEFEQFIALSENSDHHFELIGGEIFEVVSNNYASAVAASILFFIKLFLRDHNLGGYVTGADGGYQVLGERYIPDVAYISAVRQLEASHETYNPLPPDLAVEVFSPTDSEKKLTAKVVNYLTAGTLVWVIYPDDKEIAIYAPGQLVRFVGLDDVLDGGTVLPGFHLPVRDIFPA
jgi:Uma2 family endonuclease